MRRHPNRRGFILSTELALVATLLVVGLVVGLALVRDAMLLRLANLGRAVGEVRQDYGYASVRSYTAWTAGSWYDEREWERREECRKKRDRSDAARDGVQFVQPDDEPTKEPKPERDKR
jgi:hypothetical protein